MEIGRGRGTAGPALGVMLVGVLVLAGTAFFGWGWLTDEIRPVLGGVGVALLIGLATIVFGRRRRRARRQPMTALPLTLTPPTRVAPWRTPAPTLHTVEAAEFVRIVAGMFEREGHRVSSGTPGEGPHQIDLHLTRDRDRGVVMCRQTPPQSVIERHVVRELYEALLYEEARRGYLVTNARFSDPAVEWARGKSLELIDGAELAQRLRQAQTYDIPTQS